MCDTNSSIGQRIRELRKSVNMTQNALGVLTEKDGTTIGRYEKNQLPVPSDVLQILSNHFDVSIDYIVLGKTNEIHELDNSRNKKALDALTLFEQLSERDQKEIIEMMQFKLYKRGEEWEVWKIVEEKEKSFLTEENDNSKIG